MALQEGRVAPRQQESRDRSGGDLPRRQADQRRFSTRNPVSCQQPQPGRMPNPNTHTAAQAAAVAVLSCCTRCSTRSNFASDQVELSGLEPLTSCMPSGGSTSTRVHPCRSPSSPVPARPPPSACVAVLPCCTAPIRAEGHPLRPSWRPDQRQPRGTGYMRMPPGAPRHPVKQPRYARPFGTPLSLSPPWLSPGSRGNHRHKQLAAATTTHIPGPHQTSSSADERTIVSAVLRPAICPATTSVVPVAPHAELRSSHGPSALF